MICSIVMNIVMVRPSVLNGATIRSNVMNFWMICRTASNSVMV
jgi:hypothetical protein